MNLENHPCFNGKIRHLFGRVHLPIAPKCNIQCNYCVRKYDCVNESKPGITSEILTPKESVVYLEKIKGTRDNISVAGIAGPGDPFANPEETMESLRLIRAKYPDIILCLSTNGLELLPYIDELAELKVSHVTITINSIDPAIGAKIYSWIRHNKKVYRGEEGAAIIIERQLKAIELLKKHGITVKINTILIPGINEDHITRVAEVVKEKGADIINCIPMVNNPGAVFENIEAPDCKTVESVKAKLGKIMPQMTHCARCRADAVGLIGEKMTTKDFNVLEAVKKEALNMTGKKYVAVGSREGVLINQHLGEMNKIYIYENRDGNPQLVDTRLAPRPGGGDMRWLEFVKLINDCSALLVSGAGDNPEKIFKNAGVTIFKTSGLITDVLKNLFAGKKVYEFKEFSCSKGTMCSGTGTGCA